MSLPSQLEILDLRHFNAAQLGPLLRDQADRWGRRLSWDYTQSTDMLLDYIESRSLPGFVALRNGGAAGYAFAVFEATKAVIGDVYALGETESLANPICNQLVEHLLEMLQAAPAVDRIEAQLLMFPAGALAAPMAAHGFRAVPRLFMTRSLHIQPASPTPATPLPSQLTLRPWGTNLYNPVAELIHRSYLGHGDSDINDQYRTLAGAQRFLHNIIRFPGCGHFDPANSWVLWDHRAVAPKGVILASRVRPDVAHITQLCVLPPMRSQGLGQTLLEHCIAHLPASGIRSLSLTVTEANSSALHLYQRHGFTPLHRFDAQVWESRQRQ